MSDYIVIDTKIFIENHHVVDLSDFVNIKLDGTVGRKPHRVQLKRTKGWKMEQNTIICDRRSVWGNPYKIVKNRGIRSLAYSVERYNVVASTYYINKEEALSRSLELFGYDIENMSQSERVKWLAPLLGGNLACWCSGSCHCDILFKWLKIEFGQEYESCGTS